MSVSEKLALAWVVCGVALFFVQMAMWAQLNRRLPPEKQIAWHALLYDTFIWFREGGLLAQHANLYPGSRLRTVFRVLWGTFWVLVAGWIAGRK